MKSGLFYSNDLSSPLLLNLKTFFQVEFVDSIEALQKKLYESEYEFIYLDLQDEVKALNLIHAVFKLDEQIMIVTHFDYHLPAIDNLYLVSTEKLAQKVMELFSFHVAKHNKTLQVDYSKNKGLQRDYFYLSEHNPQGIVLTDAEDSIFYMNEVARNLLNQTEDKRLLKHYLKLERKVEDLVYKNESLGEEFYDSIPVVDSNLSVSVLQRLVMKKNEKIGAIYFIEDVTDEHLHTQHIKEERVKYQRLTSRLNDVILKDLDSNAYNLSYLKRKIDLEIRHAKRMQEDSRVIYIGIKDFEKKISSVTLKKSVLHKATDFLTSKFPDPHIVGSLLEGHWLVILQSQEIDVPKNFRQFCQQMTEYLNVEFAVVKLHVQFVEFVNLKNYKNSSELIKTLPLHL